MAKPTRRKFILGTLSAIGISGISAWFGKSKLLTWWARTENDNVPNSSFSPTPSEDLCVLTSSTGEGPFYITSPYRNDIREDRKGKELHINLKVVKFPECSPVENAVVEIWHCDADGSYGGYPEDISHDLWEFAKAIDFGKKPHIEPTNTNRYLRGSQKTDSDGFVNFTTIVPGWYDPRVPHIHFKVHINNKEEFIGEFWFEEEFTNNLFTNEEPYSKYGKSPYTIRNDKNIAELEEAQGWILKSSYNKDIPAHVSATIGIK